MTMTTYEILEQALERLGPNGENWGQDTDAGWTGTCVHNVIADAASPPRTYPSKAVRAVVEAVGFEMGVYGLCALYDWNDHPDRTFDEVRAAFQKAIRNEKAKAGVPLSVPQKQEVPA